jgi:hypothetical protein
VPAEARPHALIVSRNVLTAKGLRLYFCDHGVESTVTDELDGTVGHDQFTAVVVFPDEFPVRSAEASIGALARRFSRASIVVVTRHTARFEELFTENGAEAPGRLLVMPRPAWGWALLDHVVQPPPIGADP